MSRLPYVVLWIACSVSVALGEWASTTQPVDPLKPDPEAILSPSILVDLGGTWETTSQKTPKHTATQPATFIVPNAKAKWKPTQIPGPEHVGVVCWFRRTIDVPADWAGKKITLHFVRTRCETEIFWNGQCIHKQIDGNYPYTVDVTKYAKPGQKNVLMVAAAGKNTIAPERAPWFTKKWRGIPLPVYLTVTDPVSVVDIFAKPSVQNHKLTLDVTVDYAQYKKIANAQPREISLAGWVKDKDNVVKTFAPKALKIAPGEKKTVSLTLDWPDAKLWWPHRPYLYQAGVEILDGKTKLGGKAIRFGFREFTHKGHLVFLNGKKLFLFRQSVFTYPRLLENDGVREEIRLSKSRGYNSIRTHNGGLGFYNDVADEEGMIIFPEMEIGSPELYPDADPKRWKLGVEHVESMVRAMRNHPSVIMWNICNEVAFYRGKNVPKVNELLDKLGDVAQELDPTRLVSYDGDIDLQGRAPTVSLHYPWQIYKPSCMLPTTIYWLDEGKRDWIPYIWKQEKPLILGEYLNPPYSIKYPSGVSQFAGDRAYVDPDGWAEAGVQAYKWINEGYAHAKVFCLNPWAVQPPVYEKGPVVRQIILAVRQKNTTFFSGETVPRTMYVYNYTLEDRKFILNVRLWDGENTVFQKEIRIFLPGGESKEVKLNILLPNGSTKKEYHFTAQLLGENGKETTDGEDTTWSIFPKLNTDDWPKAKIAVVTTDKKHLWELRQVHLPFQAMPTIEKALAESPDLILLYARNVSQADGEKLHTYVTNGGKVVMVNTPIGSWLPGGAVIADGEKHFSTHAFRAVNQHPALEGLVAEDLQLWRPDTYVCRGTFQKPAGNSLKTILDAGGLYGLRWSPLLELTSGKGRYILCQMNIAGRLNVEPAAGFLLNNIVKATLRPVRNTSMPLCILGSKKKSILSFIKKHKFLLNRKNPSQSKLLFVDGSVTPEHLPRKQLADAAKQKGTILLHNVTPKTAAVISNALGIPITLKADEIGQVIRTGRDPILDGLSNDDFFWMSGEFSVGHDGKAAKITTPICKYVLDVKKSPGWRMLTKPAALAVYQRDGLRVVLDQILWDTSGNMEQNRCKRIGATLLANLKAAREGDQNVGMRKLAFVDFKALANRGFVDEVKGDGKGGWTDQGPKFDMRFFPVNLLGLDRNGLGRPKDDFPERSTMGGCDFKLIDPDTNNGNSCLVLDAKTKQSVSIPVEQTAKAIWFLHAAEIGWNVPKPVDIAKVDVEYEDATAVDLPLQNQRHLVDWRGRNSSPTLGQIAWRGYCVQHDPVVVCAYQWENPHPNKPIRRVKIAPTKGQYILIGLTLEK